MNRSVLLLTVGVLAFACLASADETKNPAKAKTDDAAAVVAEPVAAPAAVEKREVKPEGNQRAQVYFKDVRPKREYYDDDENEDFFEGRAWNPLPPKCIPGTSWCCTLAWPDRKLALCACTVLPRCQTTGIPRYWNWQAG